MRGCVSVRASVCVCLCVYVVNRIRSQLVTVTQREDAKRLDQKNKKLKKEGEILRLKGGKMGERGK